MREIKERGRLERRKWEKLKQKEKIDVIWLETIGGCQLGERDVGESVPLSAPS